MGLVFLCWVVLVDFVVLLFVCFVFVFDFLVGFEFTGGGVYGGCVVLRGYGVCLNYT